MKRRAIRTVEFISWTIVGIGLFSLVVALFTAVTESPTVGILAIFYLIVIAPFVFIGAHCRKQEPPSRDIKQRIQIIDDDSSNNEPPQNGPSGQGGNKSNTFPDTNPRVPPPLF